jgi:hypothetical protein
VQGFARGFRNITVPQSWPIDGVIPMSEKSASISSANDRKARLAQELRANLQKRKAQARARRAGEADRRPKGLDSPEVEKTRDET